MNIFEEVKIQSGESILKWNGKFLCSRVDPHKEAEQWIHQVTKEVGQVKNLIVLGLGCGFHIEALRRHRPNANILVIERFKEVVDFYKNQYQESFKSISVICVESLTDILNSAHMQLAVKEWYTVLPHQPSYFMDRQFYSAVKSALNGRSLQSLRFILEQRPLYKKIISVESIFSQNDGEPLGLKTLAESVKADLVGSSREAMLISTLRELIK